MDLFDSKKDNHEPLAARMRPRNLDEYVGQEHIVGKGRLLRRAIQADQLSSVIFYGPPGTGKTTLARVIANHTKSNFVTLNAVLTGVADIREAIKNADDYKKLYQMRTILFVDEVHRWNKSQQDALLPWVENGTFILIGATTENPFFEVNKALVSRSRVFQLKPLTKDDLLKAANQALNDKERGYGKWNVEFEKGALEHLVDTANGDARSLLNALELAVETTPEKWEPPIDSKIYISKETCEESIQQKVVLYDKDGDYHYDIISAFIKSLRGRDPDAALYWLSRMVRAGENANFIFRRMLISACEDTGLADPNAISIVESCANAFDRVGLPEGRYFLAHAALYLATAPKSNSSLGFFDALASVEKEDAEIPNHLKDGNRDAEGFGHGDGYMYPHAYRDHWVAQQYLPDALVGRVFYNPTDQGYESKIKEDVLRRREIQISAILENVTEKNEPNPKYDDFIFEHFKSNNSYGDFSNQKKEENLTFTPKNYKKENALDFADKSWRSRLDSNKAEVLSQIRDTMISLADLKRHSRSLILNADDGLLLWEIVRKTPEGVTCGLCKTEQGKQILEQYGKTLDDLDKPILITEGNICKNLSFDLSKILSNFQSQEIEFDKIFARDIFRNIDSIKEFAQSCDFDKLNHQLTIIISQRIPKNGQKLSDLLSNDNSVISSKVEKSTNKSTIEKMKTAESKIYNEANELFAWDGETIAKIFEENGFSVKHSAKIVEEKRRVFENEIERWFDKENSSFGKAIFDELGEESDSIKKYFMQLSKKQLFSWKNEIEFLVITKSCN